MSRPNNQKNSVDDKRTKMFASGTYRKRLKDNIELFRTYRINVHNDFSTSKDLIQAARTFAEIFIVEDSRNRNRSDSNNIETTFAEITNKPQKL